MLKKKKQKFNSLAEAISISREKINITQRELSRRTGIDNNTIAKIEKGERKKPNILSLKKLAYVLGLDSDKLLELAGYSHTEINMANSTMGAGAYFPREDGSVLLVEEALIISDERYKVYPLILEMLEKEDLLKSEKLKNCSEEELEKIKIGIEKVREDLNKKIEDYELSKENCNEDKRD